MRNCRNWTTVPSHEYRVRGASHPGRVCAGRPGGGLRDGARRADPVRDEGVTRSECVGARWRPSPRVLLRRPAPHRPGRGRGPEPVRPTGPRCSARRQVHRARGRARPHADDRGRGVQGARVKKLRREGSPLHPRRTAPPAPPWSAPGPPVWTARRHRSGNGCSPRPTRVPTSCSRSPATARGRWSCTGLGGPRGAPRHRRPRHRGRTRRRRRPGARGEPRLRRAGR